MRPRSGEVLSPQQGCRIRHRSDRVAIKVSRVGVAMLGYRGCVNTGTQARDRAAQLAVRDAAGAAAIARAIADPWYRCQALAHAAIHTREEKPRKRMLDEAFAAARELAEPNRSVTVATWPLKVLVQCGEAAAVRAHVQRLLDTIATEPSPVRRADALRMLFGAVASAQSSVARKVIEALAEASLARLSGDRRNRKGEAVLEECLPAVARIDGPLAAVLLDRLPDGRAMRVRQRIAELSALPLDSLIPWPNIGRGAE
jgi:hypothetical protein